MELKSWWQIATPHKDIREGDVEKKVFAVDLAEVIKDSGDIEYRDAETFFKRTYLTEGLKRLLENVVSRLTKEKGDKVIQLETPFGGGKTHALLSLYHLTKNTNKISHIKEIKDIIKRKKLNVNVVVFVGTVPDVIKGRTIWGEIAEQLGKYDLIKEHDEKKISPGRENISKILRDKPTLILIDELTDYVVKAKDFEEQIFAFCQELTETVNSLNNCVVVCTLPSSVPYGERGEKVLRQLKMIFGRMQETYTLVEEMERYEVIRRRLFEDIGDADYHKIVAENYFNFYQKKLKDDIPTEAREISYREKIKKAYPFHPELIDILFEKWGTLPNFQRTRGVLKTLAKVVKDLSDKEISSPLIHSSHVDISNSSIKADFINNIGNEYEGVIASDIVGVSSKSQKIDREMGTEYKKYKVATSLATSIFLNSFSSAEKNGVSIQGLRLAFLRDDIPQTIVGDTLKRLENELWYLHSDKSLYSFRTKPNLNRVIIDKEETIKDEDIDNEIKERIKKIAGNDVSILLYPKSNFDVQDNTEIKLIILQQEYSTKNPETKKFVQEILTKHSSGFRTYKNTLVFIIAETNEYDELRKSIKRLLTLKKIIEDKEFVKTLSKENFQELNEKFKDSEKSIPEKILSTYRHVATSSKNGEFIDMGMQTLGEQTISSRVMKFLKDEDRFLDKIKPKFIIDKTFGKDNEKTLGDIWKTFLKIPDLPMLKDINTLKNAINFGVRDKTFAVQIGDKTYFGEEVLILLDEDSRIIREYKEKQPPPPPTPPEPKPQTDTTIQPPLGEPQPKKYRIKAKVPWDKLSDFMKGVLMPLKKEGANIFLLIDLSADSENEISKNTIENKVKETLKQINAEILEEEYKD